MAYIIEISKHHIGGKLLSMFRWALADIANLICLVRWQFMHTTYSLWLYYSYCSKLSIFLINNKQNFGFLTV